MSKLKNIIYIQNEIRNIKINPIKHHKSNFRSKHSSQNSLAVIHARANPI